MATFENSNGTVQCNYTTTALFQDSVQTCNPYIAALQTCPQHPISQATRLQIVNQTAQCLPGAWNDVWAYNSDPSYLHNFTSVPPPTFPANTSCHYPDLVPILQQACSFDFGRVQLECNEAPDPNVIKNGQPYVDCQTEAMIQYWRCTQQKPFSEVTDCVIENAQKVNWVPPIEPYSGAMTCPDRTTYLASTGISIILVFVAVLFFTWLAPLILRKLKILFNMKLSGPPPQVWRREKKFTLRAYLVIKSLGTDVLVAYLTVLILRNAGLTSVVSTRAALVDSIFLIAVRPRVAPLTGFLGFWKGFSETGFADLVADAMLSWVAGTKIFHSYWKYINTPPSNPAAPAYDMRILGIGALMSCAPAFITLMFLFFTAASWTKNNKFSEMMAIYFMLLLAFVAFFCLLPFIAIIEVLSMLIMAIRRKRGHSSNPSKRSCWEIPLTISWWGFRDVFYPIILLMSLTINLGNWIFFVSYVKIAGDLFCPSGSRAVEALWIGLPVGITIVFAVFKKLTDPVEEWEM
ncbi:uncharacterized protein LY89DRAFT_691505 [Mollisia scopiformis]|uniref:Uncharacterized protein n=1 Tax=Mollisia scopiformis TaxID=149040 RepID=A0A132B5X2_MOLSC|nr:uncharacterized protein LY89DRAFT_691505 [Mollisia scopiformis]KUJ07808.1 hypothetical protein LY89DRAFT_691505 [Mollisia scopiformis]